MTQKMSLLDAVPSSAGNLEEAALLHAYDQSWQLYARVCDLRPVSSMNETRRIDYENSRDPEQEDERKKDLWQMLQYSAGFQHLVASKGEQVIPLPYWNLIFWKNLPVFHYVVDGSDYGYAIPVHSLLVESTFASLAEPISAETVLKLQTDLPFENLQKAFAEMVRQGWLKAGAELLVPKRFVRFGQNEPVPPTAACFEWLSTQARLRCVADVLELRKSILHQHFLHKGKPLNAKAMQRGLNVTEYDYSNVIRKILRPYLPN